MRLMVMIIAEAGQQFSAVKSWMRRFANEHRCRYAAYDSRYGLSNIGIVHGARPHLLNNSWQTGNDSRRQSSNCVRGLERQEYEVSG